MWVLAGTLKLFFVGSFAYLLLTYALRWYEVTNTPAYYRDHGERTLLRAGCKGVYLFWREYFFLVVHLLMVGADHLLRPYYYWRGERGGLVSAPYTGGRDNPLLLVHGYMMRGGSLWWLRRRLRQDGRSVWLFNYSPPGAPIPRFAEQLRGAVENVLRKTGAERVDLAGHSMGGLVILYYLISLGGAERVRKVITLGTPYLGSKLWAFSLGNCGLQMRPHSPFLERLRSARPELPMKLTAVCGDFDELVLPNENAALEADWAERRSVEGIGHVGLLFDGGVYSIVKSALEAETPSEENINGEG